MARWAVLAGLWAVAAAAQEAAPQWVTPAVRAPRLEHRTFPSRAAGTAVSYHLWTPEVYDTEPDRRFRVLYWLHGSGGGQAGLRPLVAHFSAAVRDGTIEPLLVVFPNGLAESMWCNSKDGRVPIETIVIEELIPHLDAEYRTVATRQGRLIEGFSMGGYGAARLGFKHHELFGAVSLLGAGPLQRVFTPDVGPPRNARSRAKVLASVFGGDQAYFLAQSPWLLAEQNAAALRDGTRIRQVCGDADAMLPANREFAAHLTELGVPHRYQELPDIGHSPLAVLRALGEDGWGFYAEPDTLGREPSPAE